MPYFPPQNYRYTFGPTDHGWLGWNYDISSAGTTNTLLPTAGRLELSKVRLPVPASVTNVVIYLGTAGASLTAGQCFAALYTAAGSLVGVSADQSAAWVSTGLKTMALASGPFACAAGNYFVGLWYNGTTAPAPLRNVNTAGANGGLTGASSRWCTADTGLTTTAPPTLGASSAATITWWVGVS